MRRAAVYCRISDDREGAGLGVARQEKDCRELAERLGVEVAEVYTDNDISAFDRRKTRPSYRRLLDDVRHGRVDVVLVWHTDRLHRNNLELEEWIKAAEAHSIPVNSVRSGLLDLATPDGRMTARILGATAQRESEHKAARNQRKALELADAGKLGNGGPRPFGYEDDRKTVRPAEADILRQVYSDVLAGKSLRSIAFDLAAAGVTTSQGNNWTMQALRFTLLRARNMGWREHKGRLAAPAEWEPIVDRETWEQTKALLTSRPARRRPFGRVHLLAGFLYCGRCGSALRPSRNADRQVFACRPDPGQPACGKIVATYPPLEEHVVELLLTRIETGVDLTPDPDDPTERLREQIAAKEEQLRSLAAAYADGGDFVEMRALGDTYRGQIADLRQQIAQVQVRQRVERPTEVRQEWAGYDLAQRRAVVELLIDRIDVGPVGKGTSNRFNPGRLTVVWR